MPTLRLGTRQSALAQAQARWVAEQLHHLFPELTVELVLISTSGDKPPSPPPSPARGEGDEKAEDLSKKLPLPIAGEGGGEGAPLETTSYPHLATGGLKALFTKEIEEALLDERIDLAVHSLKDMAAHLPLGLTIGAIPPREDPRDVWISKNRVPFKDIPRQARIATSAVRRQAQLRSLRPDVELVSLRGNVDTRLRKLKEGPYDGMVLALAGLRRLGREKEATEILSEDQMLPAVGQGCLALEIRENDLAMEHWMSPLNHRESYQAAGAERDFLKALGGSCQTPIAAYGKVSGNELTLTGLVADPSGRSVLRAQESGPSDQAASLGQRLAKTLLARGARQLLVSSS